MDDIDTDICFACREKPEGETDVNPTVIAYTVCRCDYCIGYRIGERD